MILLLDIGNTRIKWARLEQGKLHAYGTASHADEELALVLERVFDGPAPERVFASNVAGPLMGSALTEFCAKHYGRKPEFLVPGPTGCGVTNGYTDPTRLGADRWAAAVGAFHLYGGPVCVFDAGTALTVDVVNQVGSHLGGLIAPGPRTMRRALAGATAGLPDLGEGELALFCRDTRSAITSGGWHTAAGFVERMVQLIIKELGAETRFVLTGGDAERLAALLEREFILCPDLVLRGLGVIATCAP